MKNKLDSRDSKIYLLHTVKIKNGILPYYLKRIDAVLSFYKKEFDPFWPGKNAAKIRLISNHEIRNCVVSNKFK